MAHKSPPTSNLGWFRLPVRWQADLATAGRPCWDWLILKLQIMESWIPGWVVDNPDVCVYIYIYTCVYRYIYIYWYIYIYMHIYCVQLYICAFYIFCYFFTRQVLESSRTWGRCRPPPWPTSWPCGLRRWWTRCRHSVALLKMGSHGEVTIFF